MRFKDQVLINVLDHLLFPHGEAKKIWYSLQSKIHKTVSSLQTAFAHKSPHKTSKRQAQVLIYSNCDCPHSHMAKSTGYKESWITQNFSL